MIINIRGSSGSGKSTVVRNLFKAYGLQPKFGILGPNRPEAYYVMVPIGGGYVRGVYVLGPYLSNCGGCDAIGSMTGVLRLIEKYTQAGYGSIVFEGLLISSMYGSIGKALEPFGRQALIAFLTTSEERCRAQLGKRQSESSRMRGDKTFERHYNGTQSVKKKMLAEGILRVEDLDPDRAVEEITQWLR